MRKLTVNEVVFRVDVEQDDTPVRGNALASGDEAEDRACENEIERRLDRGDVWAWACVTVVAEWGGFRGTASIGGCSYADEADFKSDAYYLDLRDEALDDLNATIADTHKRLSVLDERGL